MLAAALLELAEALIVPPILPGNSPQCRSTI
jgi:hypothetical protein